MRKALVFAVLMSGLGLSACSVFGGSSAGPATMNTGPEPSIADPETTAIAAPPAPYVAEICGGSPADALATLPANYVTRPEYQMLAAYALEASGYVVRAVDLYTDLANERAPLTLRLVCGSNVIMDGPLQASARRRLTAARTRLLSLDADLDGPGPLHAGLPMEEEGPTAPSPQQSGGSSGAQRPVAAARQSGPLSVTRPASLDPLGQWFVHLASYSAQENAESGLDSLAARLPGLAGLFDSWQIEIRGTRTWRVGIRLGDRADAEAMCAELNAAGDYCAVLDGTQTSAVTG